jgi:hypothetical protein
MPSCLCAVMPLCHYVFLPLRYIHILRIFTQNKDDED